MKSKSKEKKQVTIGLEKEKIISEIIQKKERVHTTFRISQEGHDAIKYIAKEMRRKIADVFEVILFMSEFSIKDSEWDRQYIFSPKNHDDAKKKIRKTYVIYKKTAKALDEILKNNNNVINRDLFIERSAVLVSQMFGEVGELTKIKHKKALEEKIDPFWHQAEDIEDELINELGPNDAIVERWGYVVTLLMNLFIDIEKEIKTGERIPEY